MHLQSSFLIIVLYCFVVMLVINIAKLSHTGRQCCGAVLASGPKKHSSLGFGVSRFCSLNTTSHQKSLQHCQLSPISPCQLHPPRQAAATWSWGHHDTFSLTAKKGNCQVLKPVMLHGGTMQTHIIQNTYSPLNNSLKTIYTNDVALRD